MAENPVMTAQPLHAHPLSSSPHEPASGSMGSSVAIRCALQARGVEHKSWSKGRNNSGRQTATTLAAKQNKKHTFRERKAGEKSGENPCVNHLTSDEVCISGEALCRADHVFEVQEGTRAGR